MKNNIDGFDNIQDLILSVTKVVAWVLIIFTMLIGYFTIETKGESIMLSFVSTFFTAVSSLGIFITIAGYIWQKNYTEALRNREINELKESIIKIVGNQLTDIDIDLNNAVQNLKNGDLEKCSSLLKCINIEILQKSAYDSAKVNEELFYLITDVITEISEHKKIILDNLKKENSCDDESIKLNILYCQQAIAQVEDIHSSILAI